MRNTIKYLIGLFFILNILIYSQEKLNISTGVGFGELLNVGLHYQLEQIQIGLNYGTWPKIDVYSISSDIRFHFGDSSEFSNRKNWFILFGYIYSKSERIDKIDRTQFLNVRIGRDINFSKKIGMNISAGILGILSDETERKTCFDCPWGGVSFAFLPSIGLELFYRIY